MPQKEKLCFEEKVKLIQDYLKGKIGMREAARRGGVLLHRNRVYAPELKKKAAQEARTIFAGNIIFENKRSFKRGSRCIMLMETLTLQRFPEEEAT